MSKVERVERESAAPPKPRPILFSGEMVRAILEGRKTQTRRTLGPRWTFGEGAWRTIGGDLGGHEQWQFCRDGYSINIISCPYGQRGDQLWVRESLGRWEDGEWFYKADTEVVTVPSNRANDVTAMRVWAHHKESPHCPSIHMPRWASRLTLEITKVRVERVQQISHEDAEREGIPHEWSGEKGEGYLAHARQLGEFSTYSALIAFPRLWDKINLKRGFGWDANPWVWVIEFKRVLEVGNAG